MYQWMVYIHVLATFAFLLTHGVSSVVALRLRNQREPALARAWLELYASGSVYSVLYGSLLALLVSGIISGFMGNWWGQGWIWLSLVLLIIVIVAMFLIGSRHYSRIRKALGMAYFDGRRGYPAGESASAEEIEALLAKAPAITLAVIGFGGIAIILWLMMFKPF
ncbi:MAG: hypothetical protein KIS95_02070 [Anaerolineae bacterium]|uniref:hypothetical protein n=1 Tax=Promineifilum sp. TaxID=2664178 RepID=UPI001D3E4834|nr:hypothetical protein [Anaerolineales bacterium]MCO5180791.1 hypothetical protein [Promineifilum sp.]MCW5845989.1 hypothetical protein [Anaerolineae bacterium]